MSVNKSGIGLKRDPIEDLVGSMDASVRSPDGTYSKPTRETKRLATELAKVVGFYEPRSVCVCGCRDKVLSITFTVSGMSMSLSASMTGSREDYLAVYCTSEDEPKLLLLWDFGSKEPVEPSAYYDEDKAPTDGI